MFINAIIILKYSVWLGVNTFSRCGEDFHSLFGTFWSPSYPSAYPSAVHCTWKVTASLSRYVQVTFLSIDIEGKIFYALIENTEL